MKLFECTKNYFNECDILSTILLQSLTGRCITTSEEPLNPSRTEGVWQWSSNSWNDKDYNNDNDIHSSVVTEISGCVLVLWHVHDIDWGDRVDWLKMSFQMNIIHIHVNIESEWKVLEKVTVKLKLPRSAHREWHLWLIVGSNRMTKVQNKLLLILEAIARTWIRNRIC